MAGIIIMIRGEKFKTALYKIISTVMFDNLVCIHVAVLKFLFTPWSAYGDLCKLMPRAVASMRQDEAVASSSFWPFSFFEETSAH